MTKCPHCGKSVNPLTLAFHTKQSLYRCPACKKASRINRWTLLLANFVCIMIAFVAKNQAGLSGIANFGVFFAAILLTVTGSIWLFVRLRPIRQEPDQSQAGDVTGIPVHDAKPRTTQI